MFFSKEIIIKSPFSGRVIPIEKVPDAVFSKKMMGEGIAVEPNEGIAVSPISGEVAVLFPYGHAFGIKTEEGLELLIHIGIDTVELKGAGFKKLIKQHDKVKTGDKLIEFDINFIKEKAPSIISPVVIVNVQAVKKINKTNQQEVKAGIDEILRVVMK
jgi:PTS system glucose-specific IIA component